MHDDDEQINYGEGEDFGSSDPREPGHGHDRRQDWATSESTAKAYRENQERLNEQFIERTERRRKLVRNCIIAGVAAGVIVSGSLGTAMLLNREFAREVVGATMGWSIMLCCCCGVPVTMIGGGLFFMSRVKWN